MTNEKNPLKFINIALAIFLLGFMLYWFKELQSILLPFFIALILFFVFLPVYNFLNSKKIPSAISIILILLIVLVLSNTVSVFLFASINSFTQEFPKYEIKLGEKIHNLISVLDLNSDEIENLSKSLDIKSLFMEGKLTSAITEVLSGITGIMGNFILIIFYLIFLLSESSSIKERAKIAFSRENAERIEHTFSQIIDNIKDYISGKTLLAGIQSVVIGILLWAFGVDFYVIWAILFFFTDFIPNIGSLVATILVAIVMFLQFDSILTPVLITILLIVIQNLKGNVLEPRIIGNKLDLSPLLLLLSLVFFGYLWGITGMILSVPIMSILKIILMNFPATRPWGIMMSYNLTSIKDK